MKKGLLLLLGFLFGLNLVSSASHYVGSEISYFQLAPNSYQITFKIYRECVGAGVTQPILSVSAPGCNTGRMLPLSMVGVKLYKPYNSAIPVTCSSSTYPNYEVATYSGILNFTSAEATCSDWILSWSECCRQATANVVGQDDAYAEAKLKLTSGVINSSPAFDTLNAPFMLVSFGSLYNLSAAAIDPDGDSLVYSLVAPLSAANTPVTYKPNPATGPVYPGAPQNIIINPNPDPSSGYLNPYRPQIAQFPGPAPSHFTANYPMPSVYVNWNSAPTIPDPIAPVQPYIWSASYLFDLNPVHGELKFKPARFVAGAPLATGENKYAIAILVDEYRKINGVMTKLGSVRRETMIQVLDSPNNNPQVVSKTANNQSINSGYEIKLRPGTPLTLNFAGADLDINSMVTVSSNATYILPGATFVHTSGTSPTGTITWTPTAAHVRWQPYYFHVTLRDNNNPLRGVRTETIAVRVNATGGVTGVKEAQFSVSTFQAYPNPFTEELNFNLNLQTKAESILIYNLLGQQVDEILLKTVGLGEQKVQWQNAGKHAAGTYVARLVSANKTVQTLKFTKLN